MMCVKIISNRIDYYLYTSLGLFEIFLINLNVLHYFVSLMVFSSLFQYIVILPTMSSFITFIRLKQSDDYLRQLLISEKDNQENNVFKKNFKNFKNVSIAKSELEGKLCKFYHFHYSCRRSVFSQNAIFGYQMFETLLIYTPVNAHMVFSILLGRIEHMTAIIFIVMIIAQVSYIFGLQLISVQYPPRIHRSAALLQKVYIRSADVGLSSRCKLKLANAVAMLNVKMRYGISYGPAQLVTMGTFVKVSDNLTSLFIFVIFVMFVFSFCFSTLKQ